MTKAIRLLVIVWPALFLIPGGVRAASLSFDVNHANLPMGQTYQVGLKLDPEGEPVIGTDVILKFDPKKLELTEVLNAGAFSTTQTVMIDNQAGLVKFSLTHGYGVYLTEVKTVAKLGIKGLATGPTNLSFDFTPGKTTDTNVAATRGREVLTGVKHLTLTVLPPQVGRTGQPRGCLHRQFRPVGRWPRHR
jgi:hypothetical protein